MLVVGILAMVLLPTGVLAQTETPTVAPLDAAIQMYNDGKVEEALAEFRELHAAKPDDAAPAYWLAVAQLAQAAAGLQKVAESDDAGYAAVAKRWCWWIGGAYKDMAWLMSRVPGKDTRTPTGPENPEALAKMVAANKWFALPSSLAVSPDRSYVACRNYGDDDVLYVVRLADQAEVPVRQTVAHARLPIPIGLFFALAPEPILVSVARNDCGDPQITLVYATSGDQICRVPGLPGPYEQKAIGMKTVMYDRQYPGVAHGLYPLPGGERYLYEALDRFHVFRADAHGPAELMHPSAAVVRSLPARDFGRPMILPAGWQRGEPGRRRSRALVSVDGNMLLLDIEQKVPDAGTAIAWAAYDITAEPRFLGICSDWLSPQRYDAVRQRYLLDGQRKFPDLPAYAGGNATVAFGADSLDVSDLDGKLLYQVPLSLLGREPPRE